MLGLADEPYETLRAELKDALTEYYRVNDVHQYDELLRALGYFTHHYGKIDRLDSLNEYWLETEAQLRTDFNLFGLKTEDMPTERAGMKNTIVISLRKCSLSPESSSMIPTSASSAPAAAWALIMQPTSSSAIRISSVA